MGWDIDADNAFLLGIGRSDDRLLSSKPPRLHGYDAVIAGQMDLWRVPARLFGATSWGQWITASVEPYRAGEFDSGSGRAGIVRDHLVELESALSGADAPRRNLSLRALRRSRKRLRHAGMVAFHEGIHSLGPADREQFIKERVETWSTPAGKAFAEGLTQLAAILFLPEYLQAMGLDGAAAGDPADRYALRSYHAQTRYVQVVLEWIGADLGRGLNDVVSGLVAEGCSVAALRRVLSAALAGAHGIVDPDFVAAAVERVIAPLDGMPSDLSNADVRRLADRATAAVELPAVLMESSSVADSGHGIG